MLLEVRLASGESGETSIRSLTCAHYCKLLMSCHGNEWAWPAADAEDS